RRGVDVTRRVADEVTRVQGVARGADVELGVLRQAEGDGGAGGFDGSVCHVQPSLDSGDDRDGDVRLGFVGPVDVAVDILEVAVADVDDAELPRGDGDDEVGGADGRRGRNLGRDGHVAVDAAA